MQDLTPFFVGALFVGASLLFAVQPLFARLALPLLGGAPNVWNVTQVFFQATLLLAYAYAHASARWLRPRQKVVVHACVLATAFAVLPIALPSGWSPPAASNPVPWLLALLAVAVGLPFFAVAATAPLLQHWFAGTRHPRAGDPYFLYAASNLGSLVGLVAYPLLIEPRLRLTEQSRLWTVGYLVLAGLVGVCAVSAWRSAVPRSPEDGAGRSPAPSRTRRLRWMLLAAVPSSLTLCVTTYVTSDIAAVPLLWVVPLALYLTTFVLAFAPRPPVPQRALRGLAPIGLVVVSVVLAARVSETYLLLLALHLLVLFAIALACHGEVARDRPAAGHLTEFYLWLSAGGVLGGFSSAILAPLVFDRVWEYPLTLALAGALLPAAARMAPTKGKGRASARAVGKPTSLLRGDLVWPAVLLVILAGSLALLQARDIALAPVARLSLFVVPAWVCLRFATRPLRFGLGLAGLAVGASFYLGGGGRLIYEARSFFGVHRVIDVPEGPYHLLYHGTTLHGLQSTDPARRREPLGYFYRTGPLGHVFGLRDGGRSLRRVAVVGLGAGSMACYRQPGEQWTFYEIDPVVLRIAREPSLFSYLQECAPEAEVVLGDGRLALTGAPAGAYDLLIVDAYSSDALPIHLLTQEAVRLYFEKVAPGGLLALNLTNGHLDLEPVAARIAGAEGLVALVRDDAEPSEEEMELGKINSKWLVMAREPAALRPLAADSRWREPRRSGVGLWTDDFASVVSVLTLR